MNKNKFIFGSLNPDYCNNQKFHLKWGLNSKPLMKKKQIFFLLRLVVSIGLIGYFLISLSNKQGGLGTALSDIFSAFSSASIKWLIPVCLLHLVGFSLISWRWKILLKAHKVEAGYKRLFLFYFMAAFFNNFLPSTIGGDAVRAIESKKITGKATTSVMVIIIERLTGLMALVLISCSALVIKIIQNNGHKSNIWIFLILLISGFLVMAIIAYPPIATKILSLCKKFFPARIYHLLNEAYSAISIYYKRPLILLSAQLVSIIFQMNMVLYYFLIALALNQNPNFFNFMFHVPIMIILLMTIPAVNGLGVRTASFKELMKFPPAYALSGELIDLGMRIGYGLLGGLVFLIYRQSGPEKNPQPKKKINSIEL